jgi:hypothetical protein
MSHPFSLDSILGVCVFVLCTVQACGLLNLSLLASPSQGSSVQFRSGFSVSWISSDAKLSFQQIASTGQQPHDAAPPGFHLKEGQVTSWHESGRNGGHTDSRHALAPNHIRSNGHAEEFRRSIQSNAATASPDGSRSFGSNGYAVQPSRSDDSGLQYSHEGSARDRFLWYNSSQPDAPSVLKTAKPRSSGPLATDDRDRLRSSMDREPEQFRRQLGKALPYPGGPADASV